MSNVKPDTEHTPRQVAIFRQAANRCDVSDGAPWVALEVVAGREHDLSVWLDSEGIDAWTPIVKRLKPCRRKRAKGQAKVREVWEAQAPGYLFARVAMVPEALIGLTTFRYVRSVVGGTESPLRMREAEIADLRRRCGEGLLDHMADRYTYEVGQTLCVTTGVLAGHDVIVGSAYVRGSVMVPVEINMLGKTMDRPLPADALEPSGGVAH